MTDPFPHSVHTVTMELPELSVTPLQHCSHLQVFLTLTSYATNASLFCAMKNDPVYLQYFIFLVFSAPPHPTNLPLSIRKASSIRY